MVPESENQFARSLWRIYRRPARPLPWAEGGNLPWDKPDFSRRMLREHLDESHGAASRTTGERSLIIDWLWSRLSLRPGARVLDVTCGPGLYALELARRGCQVTGVDFSPASIAYARELAWKESLTDRCRFIEQDVRQMDFRGQNFDAALFLYGQLAVFTKEEASSLLEQIASSLRPGGTLCIELLNPDRIDKKDSNWWYTDDKGLWGESPFLHLGERFWLEAEAMSIERFHILYLETGSMLEVILCDQAYLAEEMKNTLARAGFDTAQVYPAWDGLPLYDRDEWLVYLARSA